MVEIALETNMGTLLDRFHVQIVTQLYNMINISVIVFGMLNAQLRQSTVHTVQLQ